ncbi:hypothetical protein V9K67_03600 [Paraflavisolibacter sp. H34]|uniref:hypothetical protein n=1 Tax=Huijunlia imazamoxiresistens TaxID=3127457 RepID=UPI00301935C3
MNRILLLFSLLMVSVLSAQRVPTTLVSFNDSWKFLDNGSDQDTAWRFPRFSDAGWKTGNGKFGYGKGSYRTEISYGPDKDNKYITTYFRKTIFIDYPEDFDTLKASLLRDDGVAVYVNGTEVYRDQLPEEVPLTFTTLADGADDDGTEPQTFTLHRSLLVAGNNLIAVEIHQQKRSTSDMAFDLQLWGDRVPDNQAPPAISGISRRFPAEEITSLASVTFRVTFSEMVYGVDANDFIPRAVSGNIRGTLSPLAFETAGVAATEAVVPVDEDGTTYDVSVRALAGSGLLRLDLADSGTGIVDRRGNLLGQGFSSGESYLVQPLPLHGFSSFTDITPLAITGHTLDKPQAKVWTYAGKWWSVLPTAGGTKIFRLDSTTWTDVLTLIGNTNSKADCQVVGEVVHILLFRGGRDNSYLVSVQYDRASGTYKPWASRRLAVKIVFEPSTETASMVVDARGRMWIASDGPAEVNVRWSDAPYTTWSAPLMLASGIMSDDICAIAALPGKIGVLWSNQNTRLFGFRTHTLGDDPSLWSEDEAPAALSAVEVGKGLADDHLNMMVGADGTLYCAVKTSYERPGYPKVSLLVRRPSGTWDGLYPVTANEGTRPVVLLNEAAGKLRVVYCSHENGGDILYRESTLASISFGPPITLIYGNHVLNYPSSTHQVVQGEVVILATNLRTAQAVSIIGSDSVLPPPQDLLTVNEGVRP